MPAMSRELKGDTGKNEIVPKVGSGMANPSPINSENFCPAKRSLD